MNAAQEHPHIGMDELLAQDSKDFAIRDDQAAEWALRTLAREQADTQRMVAVCDKEIARYQASKDALLNKSDQRLALLRGHLERYFETVPHRKTKTQEVYSLPSGTLRRKAQNPEYQRDPHALLQWAKASGEADYIKIKEEADWSAIKKDGDILGGCLVHKATGEIIDGVTVQQRPAVFVIEFEKEEA